MASNPSSEHLEELRRRWEAERGSRLFLQLAEEYRRSGRRGEAVEVLQSGLAEHPNHVSAHVALGRTRLEMGESAAAVGSLEKALTLDATNLVANKLLVEAYLSRGDRDRARERLDLYRLLNDSDPEIPGLRRRIDAPRGAASAEEEAGEATASELDLARAVPAPPAPAADAGAPPDAVPQWVAPPVPEPGYDGRPFGDLAAGGARDRYLAGLAAEGIFALEVTGLEPALEDEPGADEPPDVVASPLDEPPVEALPRVDEPWRDARPEAVAEAEEEALAVEVGDPFGEPLRDSEEALGEPEAPPRSPLPQPAVAAGASARATATLGRLYLDQGHPAEARRIFSELLAADPASEAAREGLARAEDALGAGGPSPVTASDLLREAEPGQPARRAVLRAYLGRIRRHLESHPPDVP